LLPLLSATPGQKVSITVPMSTKQAKTAFDTILNAPSGDAQVDEALKKLHRM
jgi:hypothetical protein